MAFNNPTGRASSANGQRIGHMSADTISPVGHQEVNQHGLYVKANTDRLQAAALSAAVMASKDLELLPYKNSKIGKAFENRQRRVLSAHVERAHGAELDRQQQQISEFVHTNISADGKGAAVAEARALTVPANMPLAISSFVVSNSIPSTLPRSSHGTVVADAYRHVLVDAAKGKPTVSLDDLPEEQKVLVQLTSVVPICGKTAFTLPFTLTTALRALHRNVLELAKLPANIERVEGEEHARSASAAYPHSRSYLQSTTGIYRGQEYSNATPMYVPSNPDGRRRPPRPINRPGSSAPPMAEGGITLHLAGSDVPLDLDKSLLDLGHRFPPLLAVRGYRLEYYLATAGSDRRIACPWRPHMTLTDVAKDIAKRLYPKDFRHTRASIEGEGIKGPTKVYLDLAKSIRFVSPDLVEDDEQPLTAFGIGSSIPDKPRVLRFIRTVFGKPTVATLLNVDPTLSLRAACQRAAAMCRDMLDAELVAEATAHIIGAEMGRASTTDGNSIPANADGGAKDVQFDDIDEEVSPGGNYYIYRHPIAEKESGVPTFSYNATNDYIAEGAFPYFISSEEDYTISHASDRGVLPGVEVLVEFFDPYRGVWSGDILTPKESIYTLEGAKLPQERQVIGRNIVSATTSRYVPQTAFTVGIDVGVKPATPESSRAVQVPARDGGAYPIASAQDQLGRIAYYPEPTDSYDLLTVTCERGQRLRMFATASTTASQILDFVWSQTGDMPQETYLWLDHGQRLAGQHDQLQHAGVGPSATIHARHRPRLWLGEVLTAPAVDRSLSFTSLPDVVRL
eukprot:GILI01021556.1.p1 GENE.GILI01021556.1~~GILI01021556.1.p1  ORF type:complete len:935 (-),score=153.33 GILI01021556.1:50-2434(-)